MSTVGEIESALKELPLQEAQGVAQWLQNYLDQQVGAANSTTPQVTVNLPYYASRRRRILGNKILPNMVMLGREQERCSGRLFCGSDGMVNWAGSFSVLVR